MTYSETCRYLAHPFVDIYHDISSIRMLLVEEEIVKREKKIINKSARRRSFVRYRSAVQKALSVPFFLSSSPLSFLSFFFLFSFWFLF